MYHNFYPRRRILVNNVGSITYLRKVVFYSSQCIRFCNFSQLYQAHIYFCSHGFSDNGCKI